MNLRQIGIIRTLGLALLIVMAFSISLSPSVTSEDGGEETEILTSSDSTCFAFQKNGNSEL